MGVAVAAGVADAEAPAGVGEETDSPAIDGVGATIVADVAARGVGVGG